MAAFWGKLCRLPNSSAIEELALVDHCIDVAQVFRALCDLPGIRKQIAPALPTDESAEACLDRLAVFALLHDMGKCNTGFQAKRDPNANATAGHVLEVLGLFQSDRQPEAFKGLIGEMGGWFESGLMDVQAMLLASLSHHGRPISVNDLQAKQGDLTRWWQQRHGLDPMQGVVELVDAARCALPDAFGSAPPMAVPPRIQHRFAGMVMLADWIGSDTRFFPYRTPSDESRPSFSRIAAGRAVEAIGLVTSPWQEVLATCDLRFESIFGRAPYPLQRATAEELALDEDARVLLIESETGSGKTEAALAWFFRLFASRRVDSLYFALPTRVAARELYGRVVESMRQAFPDESRRPSPVLLAVPGYVRIDGEPAGLPDPAGRLWPDEEADAMAEEVWAAERPKRFLAAPIAVGTIDQALLSALQVKHAHLRSVCLDRALLVVDEVHASDPYMREILAHLLDGHTTRGGYSALLSATLGESARERLLRKPRVSVEDAIARPYPLLSTRGAERPQLGTGRTKSVRLELFEGLQVLQPVCDRLVQALEHGARVLAVCNTVARANALLRAIEGEDRIPREQMFGVGGVNCPHHGRFARPDREILDAEISKRLGPGSPAGPLLVVGTQTLEQSLDIDADWLLTDPCPMDVLLQRFGRLHRHPRAQRPSLFETPQATMLIPEGGDFSQYVSRKQGEGRGPAGIGRVYADMRILQCTVDALRAQADITIPRDNRSLVEAATHPDSLAQLSGAAWTAHTQYLTGTLIAQLRQAELGRLEELPFGECQYPSKDDGPVATRLGAGSYTLRLPRTMTSPLGQAIDEVAIPFHMLPKLDDGAVPSTKLLEVDALTPTPEGFDLTVQHKSYRYTRFGLETGDA